MTKEEALNKIEELKQYVSEFDQQGVDSRILKVTQYPVKDHPRLMVNDIWVANIHLRQDMSDPTDYLINLNDDYDGYWVDMDGNTVEGELRFIPKF